MKRRQCPNKCGRSGTVSRRALLAAGAGLAGGLPLGWYAYDQLHPKPVPVEMASHNSSDFGMPGKYKGKVVEIRHPDAVGSKFQIRQYAVEKMMAQGMCSLTGADHQEDAWRSFFCRDDVIGIKVNPVGRSRGREVGSISSFEVILEIVKQLKRINIPGRNILLFERYADEFRQAGYDALIRERIMSGVRWYASAASYTSTQLAIDGHDSPGSDPHVVGYDPDTFVSMGFAAPEHSARDDRRFRSHLSGIVTRYVNKIITVPCLKDHKSAGVTLALKNLSHGMNNNVNRSHLSGLYQANGDDSGPNQCNTFIPTAVAQEPLRQKSTLHILDGLIGVYEGGPGSWNRTWAVWPRKSLFFATDPVAMDMVGWRIIDQKRQDEGWIPVSQMGLLHDVPRQQMSRQLLAMSSLGGPVGTAIAMAEHQRRLRLHRGEPFDRRQPEHIMLAGLLGLGEWQQHNITHTTEWLGS